jgi:hypothetical protein
VQVTIRDTGDLKAVAKALKQVADGKELRKQLTRELRDVARPLVPKVRAAWLAAPSKGLSGRKTYNSATGRVSGRGPTLRSLLAKATRSEVRLTGKQAGVRIRTDGRKMPDGMKSLPGYAEGIRRRPWRHPVYGDRETWVSQQPFPRFYQAVQPDEAAARRACEEAVETVLQQIARAT